MNQERCNICCEDFNADKLQKIEYPALDNIEVYYLCDDCDGSQEQSANADDYPLSLREQQNEARRLK